MLITFQGRFPDRIYLILIGHLAGFLAIMVLHFERKQLLVIANDITLQCVV